MSPSNRLEQELQALDWQPGLTRDEVRSHISDFPDSIYLELPATKQFYSPTELLLAAANAAVRAEGEGVGADFDSFGTHGVERDGGPDAWGPDPLYGEEHREPSQNPVTCSPRRALDCPP